MSTSAAAARAGPRTATCRRRIGASLRRFLLDATPGCPDGAGLSLQGQPFLWTECRHWGLEGNLSRTHCRYLWTERIFLGIDFRYLWTERIFLGTDFRYLWTKRIFPWTDFSCVWSERNLLWSDRRLLWTERNFPSSDCRGLWTRRNFPYPDWRGLWTQSPFPWAIAAIDGHNGISLDRLPPQRGLEALARRVPRSRGTAFKRLTSIACWRQNNRAFAQDVADPASPPIGSGEARNRSSCSLRRSTRRAIENAANRSSTNNI